MQELIPVLIAAVAVATLLNVVLKRFNMPTVIGYIFTGAVIGPLFGIHVHGNEALEHIAEFGIVFLMFIIGLEFSVDHLKSMKKEVFLYGGLQVAGTGLLIAAVATLLLDIEFKYAVVAGTGLALSSTAIVLKLLNESGQIRSEYGRNALGILLFQDIAVIPILLMITILTSEDKGLGDLLLETAINAVLTLAILIAIGKYALGHFFRTVSNANSKEIYMGSILFVVVGSAYVAHHFGFSYTLGAFVAGMMIADTIYKYQVEADLIPFRDLLLGVFFVSVGLQIDLQVVVANIVPVLLLGVAVLAIKAAAIYAILVFSSSSREVALKSALSLSQIGEFALVIFSLILANKMIDGTWVQIVMVTVVLTMIATPFILNNLDRIVGLFFKVSVESGLQAGSEVFGEHIILCGYGSFGRAVSERLERAGINHIVVTNNTDGYVKAKEQDKLVVFGDAADRVFLESLHIQKAIATVIAVDDVETVKQISAAITLIDKDLRIIAKVPSEEDRHQLSDFNHELVLDGNSNTAELLVERISKSKLLAEETSHLVYLGDYSIDRPAEAIELVRKEQVRLLDVISASFDGLREGKDIMHQKALYACFDVISEIIAEAIKDIMSHASLSPREYERINTLLDNQHQLQTLSGVMVSLGQELKGLSEKTETQSFSKLVVEGLDTILLSLKDLAAEFNSEELTLLRHMTSDGGGRLSSIRESYLGESHQLGAESKALVLSTTNHIEQVRGLFRNISENYQGLAELAAG